MLIQLLWTIYNRKYNMDKFDVCIAGAGVVGLAIAYQLSQSKNYSGSKSPYSIPSLILVVLLAVEIAR